MSVPTTKRRVKACFLFCFEGERNPQAQKKKAVDEKDQEIHEKYHGDRILKQTQLSGKLKESILQDLQ